KYVLLRNWLLRHGRLGGIVGLPRFTFKGSGADVSASVIFIEKRSAPLDSLDADADYDVAVEVIDRVGWVTGDKNGQITYRRDEDDGTFILGEDDEVIVDSDFPKALHDLRSSQAAEDHPWLRGNVDSADIGAEGAGWSVSVSTVLHDDRYLTLDPKRLSRKRADVVSYISGGRHFALGDV